MEKINSKWIHDGREYEVVNGICSQCDFYKMTACSCGFANSCQSKIGLDKCFKLKEPKMKKEELEFKCILGSPARNEKMYDALAKAGLKNSIIKEDFVKSAICLRVGVFCGSEVSPTWAQKITESYEALDYPEVTYAEALELLKRVEPVAPEFDIKLRDEVLVRDEGCVWGIAQFARMTTHLHGAVIFGGHSFQQVVKYVGNEHLHGTTNTPDGWWECCEGKPVWKTK